MDLKPENVLIDSKGFVKLTDFGLSLIESQESLKNYQGTPEYSSPEILFHQEISKQIDWWSLGCLLYEISMGKPPFEGKSRNELFQNIKFNSPIYPTYFSADFVKLLKSLLQKKPSQRLGYSEDAAEVKNHPWFADVDWERIAQKQFQPSFIPRIDHNNGLQNFSPQFTESTINSLEIQSSEDPV